jgi:hypothetical protein
MSSKIVQIAAVATILLGTASATLAAPRHHVRTAPAASATARNHVNTDYSAFAASGNSGAVFSPAAAQRIPEPTYFGLAAGKSGQTGDN